MCGVERTHPDRATRDITDIAGRTLAWLAPARPESPRSTLLDGRLGLSNGTEKEE